MKEGVSTNAYKAFHSPTHDWLTIEVPAVKEATPSIELRNMNGQMLRNATLTPWQTRSKMNMENLADGIYLL